MGRRTFDLLGWDMDLPDMGSAELLRGPRFLSSSPKLDIVWARHDPQCLRDCRDVVGFLRTKPLDLEQMERLFLEAAVSSDKQWPEDTLEPPQAG